MAYLVSIDAPVNLLDAVKRRQKTEALARKFAAMLANELTAAEMAEVRIRNISIGDGCCASHDFCDANMVMLPAFVAVFGREPEPDDLDSALWSDAWNIAKRDHLTARPE